MTLSQQVKSSVVHCPKLVPLGIAPLAMVILILSAADLVLMTREPLVEQ